jgi:hypothetical protein
MKGAIAINSAIVTLGIFLIVSVAGAYTHADAQISEVNKTISTNLDKQNETNTQLQVQMASVNTKLDLLLKSNGIDPKQLSKNQ